MVREAALCAARNWLACRGSAMVISDVLINEAITGLDILRVSFVSPQQFIGFFNTRALASYMPEAVVVKDIDDMAMKIREALQEVAREEDTRNILLVSRFTNVHLVNALYGAFTKTDWIIKLVEMETLFVEVAAAAYSSV